MPPPGAGGRGPKINIGPDQHRIHGTKDPESAALVPARVRETGALRIGVSGLARWGLTGEQLKTSRINPPGLPRTAD
ncbi:hypothetical protein ACWGGS_15565 [Streptomyces decoyicus]